MRCLPSQKKSIKSALLSGQHAWRSLLREEEEEENNGEDQSCFDLFT